ncbi:ergothioneine biosynthesis protein EgtC [Streptomyces sp. Ag109_G2-15]|uniref:ergothioneine biosynthesis protein EgtC n=1 Tax=Streptomyces sp. Ag109_G2-15 TaxID=1938850 RepID=UPI000BC56A82|nr:ergothioneine biosynthesis protein EgtC [Streptomyces sp. Ag109_G2-15]SOD80738.1 glutamine amidotransferase [Streptomyces sp. Ag109_G2-15]
MCRHLGYVGDPLPIGDLLLSPEHGLVRQSWAPRHQRHGTVNADGFGVGWYADGDPVPGRYRRSGPIWADRSFADLARLVRTGALLAAVRDATRPGPEGEAAAAPFVRDRWLFSHNGALPGWPASVASLASALPAEELLGMEAHNDSAFVWTLIAHRLRAGEEMSRALAGTVAALSAAAPSARLNFLLTNGRSLAATAWGDTLWYRLRPGAGVVVASEPYDDDPAWAEVPDRSLLRATPTEVLVAPLEESFS